MSIKPVCQTYDARAACEHGDCEFRHHDPQVSALTYADLVKEMQDIHDLHQSIRDSEFHDTHFFVGSPTTQYTTSSR
jgi:hypothetical protein